MRERLPKNSGLCSRCHGPRSNAEKRYCKTCHAAWMREHRPKYSDLTDEQRQRSNARAYAHVCRDGGKLIKQSCEQCGDENSQIHHDDYSKPLEIKWLCRKHHLELHSNRRSVV